MPAHQGCHAQFPRRNPRFQAFKRARRHNTLLQCGSRCDVMNSGARRACGSISQIGAPASRRAFRGAGPLRALA